MLSKKILSLSPEEALKVIPSEDFYEYATRDSINRSYCKFAIKGSMVVAAVESDLDLLAIECKFQEFKKLPPKKAIQEAGCNHVHVWEYGVNTIEKFNDQPVVEIILDK